jgi:hypothetical protein
VSWLFTDPAVYEECGPYVHKGKEKLPWPRLAWLYARLKPPLTVGMWINQYNVDLDQIDVRRFITFGVIKVNLDLSSPFIFLSANTSCGDTNTVGINKKIVSNISS